ncbi:MAG: TrkH family potassium uptake protein [Bacteroidales bacterium]|nr:TrkH family potassium uptake protein [Bacteroidales bacterium]
MNLKVISRNVGTALLVSALFMFFSILVSVGSGNDSALAALIISFTITFIVGIFPFIFVRKTSAITMKDGYLIIVLSWFLSFIFGMLPYALWGGPFSVVDAWFESVSGYTTTGATILSNVEALPNSLLFWRASTHFIGGLGVVVFLLLVIPNAAPVRLRLTNMEISSLSRTGYRARTNKTVVIFSSVYLGLVALSFICYKIAGLSSLDAICHSFSVSATGGFSSRNLSIASFNSLPVTLITMVFMLLASLHFGMIFFALVTRSLKPFNNPVLKCYLTYLLGFSVIAAIVLRTNNFAATWGQAFLDGSFQMLSYASTTGFATVDNSHWPYFLSLLIMLAGTICGMAGSTTGGIKTDRVMLLFRLMVANIKESIHPNSVHEVRFGKNVVSRDDIYPHVMYIALFMFIWLVSAILSMVVGGGMEVSLMATLASLGNVGPSTGVVGTFGNYSLMPSFSKVIYTLDMFLGRVEMYPVLAVIYMGLNPEKRF